MGSTSLVGLKWVSGATKGLPTPRFAVLLFLVNFSVLPRLPSGMLIMVPLMIVSTLGVMLFASLSHGLNFTSLLGADSTFVGGDGTGNEGNIDLTTRRLLANGLASKEALYSSGLGGNIGESNPKKLPLPQFTTYGSPVAPSYASYTFNGPPSPTALASLGQRREEYDEYEDEDYEEQELEKVGEEGSLLSWLAVPAMVVLGLLFLPSSIPGSGMLTRLALDTLAVAETSRHFPILDGVLGAIEPRQGGSVVNEVTLFVMVFVGMLLAPTVLSFYGWDQLNIVNNNNSRSMPKKTESSDDSLEAIAAKVHAAIADFGSKDKLEKNVETAEESK